jgi:hypothetical protein
MKLKPAITSRPSDFDRDDRGDGRRAAIVFAGSAILKNPALAE